MPTTVTWGRSPAHRGSGMTPRPSLDAKTLSFAEAWSAAHEVPSPQPRRGRVLWGLALASLVVIAGGLTTFTTLT